MTGLSSDGGVPICPSSGISWADENGAFEGPVHSHVFVPSLDLRKGRPVLLASLVPAILGHPLIPLLETVHGPRKRSAL